VKIDYGERGLTVGRGGGRDENSIKYAKLVLELKIVLRHDRRLPLPRERPFKNADNRTFAKWQGQASTPEVFWPSWTEWWPWKEASLNHAIKEKCPNILIRKPLPPSP